jgi:predicted TIM-barrel fold metal-dependent hydrolase
VHLHPPRLASAIGRHFADHHGWLAAHSWEPPAVAATLGAHGVERFCAFSYAHKAGIARSINAWLAETAARLPAAIPFGTVHVEDADLPAVVDEALGTLGLAGVKLHCSVQRFTADDPRLFPLYERLQADGRPLMVHAGSAPYRDAWTGITHFTPVMRRFPRLRACVAHLGCFDHEAFLALTGQYPDLYVDTTMALSPQATPWVGIEPEKIPTGLLLQHQDRILLGSDFPLIPYPYEEEYRWTEERRLPPEVRRKIFTDNARRFLGRWLDQRR